MVADPLTKEMDRVALDRVQEQARRLYYLWTVQDLPVEDLIAQGMIKREDLVERSYYLGCCRNTTIALWYRGEFHFLREKWSVIRQDAVPHVSLAVPGFDAFVPVLRLTESS